MQIIKRLLAKLARKMADPDPRGWPPDCWLITYQPERPIANDESK